MGVSQSTPKEEVFKVPDQLEKVAVLGGGSFGTALAQHFAKAGLKVKLWCRSKEQATAINETRRNPKYVKDFDLHPAILATSDLGEALREAEWVLLAVPSIALRVAAERLKTLLPNKLPLVLACKGIEIDPPFMTMDEVLLDVLGADWHNWILALSGPSFAKEMLRDQPTAVTIASANEALAKKFSAVLSTKTFHAYWSDDIIGTEIGGALKNVIAIAAGACVGLGFGANAKAMLITRGLNEITKIAVAKGANPLTLAGLAGIGDLMLTCGSTLSRNNRVGLAMGQGKSLQEALDEIKEVAEGVRTTKAAYLLMKKLNVKCNIIEAVYRVLYEEVKVEDALEKLLIPPLKAEFDLMYLSKSKQG